MNKMAIGLLIIFFTSSVIADCAYDSTPFEQRIKDAHAIAIIRATDINSDGAKFKTIATVWGASAEQYTFAYDQNLSSMSVFPDGITTGDYLLIAKDDSTQVAVSACSIYGLMRLTPPLGQHPQRTVDQIVFYSLQRFASLWDYENDKMPMSLKQYIDRTAWRELE